MEKISLSHVLGVLLVVGILCSTCMQRTPTYANNAQIECIADTVTIVRETEMSELNLFAWCDSVGKGQPTDASVKMVLEYFGVQHQHLVYAQMRLESGNYKSKLAQENCNYFGMKQPKVRQTLSLGAKNSYASYRNWVYSVADYALWQRGYAYDLTEDEYLDKLKNYAFDKNYVSKVKKIAKSFGNTEKHSIFAMQTEVEF